MIISFFPRLYNKTSPLPSLKRRSVKVLAGEAFGTRPASLSFLTAVLNGHSCLADGDIIILGEARVIGHEEEATRHEGDHAARGFLGGGDEGIQPKPVNKDLLKAFSSILRLRKTKANTAGSISVASILG